MIYATRGLVESMLRFASDSEPDSVTVSLSVTPAGELPETGLEDEVPVFTHFYMPAAGGSVNAVFGMDIGTPVGQTQGRFVSHPQGELSISKTDDLAEVVFVAVPPWELETVAVFDRSGRKVDLEVLDVEPPQASL
ncbi:hypothetical protein VB773_14770 [Haloarculaceae archaeon H-GB2-1]|nr:hypothetical protein [Haloarculaceae archaeon H-GB1-1]MEA5387206.1 hypothetical protein [Haloarculaceae archaeon H-GB11]MEA5408702.1 hypothetical protein [Haloarculaceae archaeon H-GB2-1]